MARARRNENPNPESNIIRVRRAFHASGEATKPDISRQTGLTFSTVSKLVDAMERYGELSMMEIDITETRNDAQRYRFNSQYRLGLMMHLEGDTLFHEVIDYTGKSMVSGHRPFDRAEGPMEMQCAVASLRERHPALYAAAFGIPGVVEKGLIRNVHGARKFENFDLRSLLERKFGLAVAVENDMNCTALGFHHTSHREDADTVAYILIGVNGPGAGFLVNGRVMHGSTGFSGEIGRMPIYEGENLMQALYSKNGFLQPIFGSGDNPHAVDSLARMIASMAVLINPNEVLFCTDDMTEDTLMLVRTACEKYISPQHIPVLSLREWRSDYRNGLHHLAMEQLIAGI